MRQLFVRGLVGTLAVVGLIGSAPHASAGCMPGAPWAVSKCDGPVQSDGTWQRCVTFQETGRRIYTTKDCQTLGPDQHPWGMAFQDPTTHIDD